MGKKIVIKKTKQRGKGLSESMDRAIYSYEEDPHNEYNSLRRQGKEGEKSDPRKKIL